MFAEPITFPSATNISKLSASPTTKIPEATDWILQDFYNTVTLSKESPSLLTDALIIAVKTTAWDDVSLPDLEEESGEEEDANDDEKQAEERAQEEVLNETIDQIKPNTTSCTTNIPSRPNSVKKKEFSLSPSSLKSGLMSMFYKPKTIAKSTKFFKRLFKR
ncbi:hypothetical protein RMATCC62417_16419 [Rhizopus microsporus]|nr:hypothetical protein RMATCC62417_16419 [Rhizopus microsporus]